MERRDTREGKEGQLSVFIGPFSPRDEATGAATFDGAGMSRTRTAQKGLGDRRMSDRTMPKCGASDPASDPFLRQSCGSRVTACPAHRLFLYLAVALSPLRRQKGRAPLINDSISLIVLILMEKEEERGGTQCTHADKCVKRHSELTFSGPLLFAHVFRARAA